MGKEEFFGNRAAGQNLLTLIGSGRIFLKAFAIGASLRFGKLLVRVCSPYTGGTQRLQRKRAEYYEIHGLGGRGKAGIQEMLGSDSVYCCRNATPLQVKCRESSTSVVGN